MPLDIVHARQDSANPASTLEQIQEDLRVIPCKPKDRLNAVRHLFAKMGATSSDVSLAKIHGTENYVVKRQGTGQDTIVIGAHYDFIKAGCGAVDNWTGIVVLAHLYRTISRLGSAKTILFVAFDREEGGLNGSRAMVQSIPKGDVPHYCAMVNIDSFGMGGPMALQQASSPKLVQLGVSAAEGLKVPFYQKVIKDADSDSSSYLKRGIPAITLTGLTEGWPSILHTIKDQQSAIEPASVFVGYRFALSMWSSIDAAPCNSYRDQP
jgi:Zn-dependent M28 family amino/carboxypeptidase